MDWGRGLRCPWGVRRLTPGFGSASLERYRGKKKNHGFCESARCISNIAAILQSRKDRVPFGVDCRTGAVRWLTIEGATPTHSSVHAGLLCPNRFCLRNLDVGFLNGVPGPVFEGIYDEVSEAELPINDAR